jgi:hypothetical protein
MLKRAPQGMVGVQFAHKTIANAKLNQPVVVSGDMEVDSTAGTPIGTIAAIDKFNEKVTVEMFASQVFPMKIGTGGVTAGDHVKLSDANTVVKAAPGTTATDVPLTFGIALVGGLAGADTTVVPL